MPRIECRHVEIWLFRRVARTRSNSRVRFELLLLRRAPDRSLPGVWQPVTGGIAPGEPAWRAAAREVKEETGMSPERWWTLEAPTLYYEPARDVLMVLPLFAAELDPGLDPRLSREHDRFAFVAPSVARRRVHWLSQRHAIDALEREHFAAPGPPAALEITSLVASSAARRPPNRRRRAGTPATPTGRGR